MKTAKTMDETQAVETTELEDADVEDADVEDADVEDVEFEKIETIALTQTIIRSHAPTKVGLTDRIPPTIPGNKATTSTLPGNHEPAEINRETI